MSNRSRTFHPSITFTKGLGKLISLIQGFTETLYDGLIPPLLGHRRMQMLIDASYSDVGMYETRSHNLSGLYLWETEAIGEYIAEGKRFIVLAAGGGREVIALLRKGVHVDAWECNTRLLEYGNRLLEKESLPCRIQPMKPNKFPQITKGISYDFCILGWSAYSHVLHRDNRVALLADVGKVVKGPVLISFGGKRRAGKLKRILRDSVTFLPGTTKGISYDLVASPDGTVAVGFDEKKISEEAGDAGLIVKRFKNHKPEYPYAVLLPKEYETCITY